MNRSRIYILNGDELSEKNVTINNYLFWDSLPIERKNIQTFRKIPEIKFKMGESEEFDLFVAVKCEPFDVEMPDDEDEE